MIMNRGKCCDFNMIWIITVCLFVVSPVQLFPQLSRDKIKNEPDDIETLNFKATIINLDNEIEKPVFDSKKLNNSESEKSVTVESIKKPSSDQGRQLNIPFMGVPANWLATFQPSNAVILTQKVPLRIWAIGSVSRFPSFLENFVQRVQSYYSIYKYHDLSRPASLGIINQQYHQNDPTNVFDPMDQDPIEDDLDDFETSTMDYIDTTTDMNYLDDESTESSEDLGSGHITV